MQKVLNFVLWFINTKVTWHYSFCIILGDVQGQLGTICHLAVIYYFLPTGGCLLYSLKVVWVKLNIYKVKYIIKTQRNFTGKGKKYNRNEFVWSSFMKVSENCAIIWKPLAFLVCDIFNFWEFQFKRGIHSLTFSCRELGFVCYL